MKNLIITFVFLVLEEDRLSFSVVNKDKSSGLMRPMVKAVVTGNETRERG